MLEVQLEKLNFCREKMLTQQCENEDFAKEILLYSKDKPEFEQEERRKFLNKRLENRKNLYIYPRKANA